MHLQRSFSLICSLLATACVFSVGMASAQAQPTRHFNLPEQTVAASLREVGGQANLNVLFDAPPLESMPAPAIDTTSTVDEVLSRLLRGSGYQHRFLNETTVVLAEVKEKRPNAGAKAPAGIQISETAMREARTPSESAARTNSESDKPDVDSAGIKSTAERISTRTESESAEEVVVTGTHIRGAVAAGSPLSIYDRNYLERSGHTSVANAVRSLPENFSGGQNLGIVGAEGDSNTGNQGWVSSANLRGLGSNATLSLVNGRRIGITGSNDAVDISLIPLEAVERIEVLKDGASAQYGSDAIGGVVNFVLRQHFEGAQVGFSLANPSRDGGGLEQRYNALGGANWDSGQGLLGYEHVSQDNLPSDRRNFSAPAGTPPIDLFPSLNQNSALLLLNQSLGERVELFAQPMYTKKVVDAQSGLPGILLSNSHSNVDERSISAGLAIKAAAGWRAELAGGYGETEASDDVRDESAFGLTQSYQRTTNSFYSTEIKADGPLATLKGRDLSMALGAGYRNEQYSTAVVVDSNEVTAIRARRDVKFGYMEFYIPWVDASNARVGMQRLALSAAGRYESYTDAGSSFVPKVGLTYGPTKDLSIRGSWGRSFKAPSFFQEFSARPAILLYLPDTSSGGLTMLLTGSNPNLVPQTAKTWTAGLDYVLPFSRGTVLGMTYFAVNYQNKITTPFSNAATVLIDPSMASFVVRDPSESAQQQLIDQSTVLINASGSEYDPATVNAVVFGQYQNVASQDVRGVDVSLQHTASTRHGILDLYSSGSVLTIDQKIIASLPSQGITGFIFNPPKRKIRAGAAWTRGEWSANITANYISASVDNIRIPSAQVASWTTWDGQVAYRAATGRQFLSGVVLSISGMNLFDRDPPGVSPTSTSPVGLGLDSTNSSAFGRVLALQAKKSW